MRKKRILNTGFIPLEVHSCVSTQNCNKSCHLFSQRLRHDSDREIMTISRNPRPKTSTLLFAPNIVLLFPLSLHALLHPNDPMIAQDWRFLDPASTKNHPFYEVFHKNRLHHRTGTRDEISRWNCGWILPNGNSANQYFEQGGLFLDIAGDLELFELLVTQESTVPSEGGEWADDIRCGQIHFNDTRMWKGECGLPPHPLLSHHYHLSPRGPPPLRTRTTTSPHDHHPLLLFPPPHPSTC